MQDSVISIEGCEIDLSCINAITMISTMRTGASICVQYGVIINGVRLDIQRSGICPDGENTDRFEQNLYNLTKKARSDLCGAWWTWREAQRKLKEEA